MIDKEWQPGHLLLLSHKQHRVRFLCYPLNKPGPMVPVVSFEQHYRHPTRQTQTCDHGNFAFQTQSLENRLILRFNEDGSHFGSKKDEWDLRVRKGTRRR